MNFADTIDWAVDLQEYDPSTGCPEGACNYGGKLFVAPEINNQGSPTVTCATPCNIIWPPFQVPGTTTITFPPYTTSPAVVWTATVTTTNSAGSTRTSTSLQRTLITKTIEYHTSAGGTVTSIATTETVSAYCQRPSPGRKIWNGQQWAPHALGGSFDRRGGDEEFNWYMCDGFPGYNGPSGRPATKKRRRDRVQVDSGHESQPHEAPRRHSNYRNQTAVDHALLKLSSSPMSGTIGPHPRPRPVLAARQQNSAAGGGFLDPSAFLYIGCGSSGDGNLCYYLGDASSSPPLDAKGGSGGSGGGNGGGGGGGSNYHWNTPDPSKPPPPPPPPPSEPDAKCGQYDDLGLAMRLNIYNIRYCKTDNVEKSLRDEEEGCAALTFWEWTPETIEDGASAWFDLPYFIKAGCFERAIKVGRGAGSNVERNEFFWFVHVTDR
ncbi:hypothetical protein MCOR14_009294 [Pyricularia oryzae]|nr:hypothetical protein MCOR14_009294 [Pyricularia oryzae]